MSHVFSGHTVTTVSIAAGGVTLLCVVIFRYIFRHGKPFQEP
jgi:hypothetical protein